MKKKSLIISIVSSVIACILLVGSILLLTKKKNYQAKYDGTITIEVYISESNQKTKKIKYLKDDTLQKLIEKNFDNVLFEDTIYGPFLKNIEGYETPADFSTFISVYVNDVYSSVGIGGIAFENGTKISLKVESYTG